MSRMLRRRLRTVAPLVAAAMVAVMVGGCSLASKGSYDKHGVSFHYPKDWERGKLSGLSAQNAGGLWTEAFKPSSSSSKADMIFITEYRTPVAITWKNRATYSDEIASSVATVTKRAGGKILAGPAMVSMGGLPGFGFRISATTVDGLSSESRILLVWNGKTEYYLNCQHDTNGTRSGAVERACTRIISSFELS